MPGPESATAAGRGRGRKNTVLDPKLPRFCNQWGKKTAPWSVSPTPVRDRRPKFVSLLSLCPNFVPIQLRKPAKTCRCYCMPLRVIVIFGPDLSGDPDPDGTFLSPWCSISPTAGGKNPHKFPPQMPQSPPETGCRIDRESAPPPPKVPRPCN